MKSLANDLVNISQIKWHIAAKFELQWKRFSNKHHSEFIIFKKVSLYDLQNSLILIKFTHFWEDWWSPYLIGQDWEWLTIVERTLFRPWEFFDPWEFFRPVGIFYDCRIFTVFWNSLEDFFDKMAKFISCSAKFRKFLEPRRIDNFSE